MSTQRSQRQTIILILLLTILGQASIDIYLPSFPAIMQQFHTSSNLVQISLTGFLIASGVSQLVLGLLSDQSGRRKVVLYTLALYMITTLLCAIAPSMTLLIILRITQGLFAGIVILARTIMRDCFEGKKLAKISSYQAIAWTTVPLCAPVIGGYIQHYLNWRFSFAFLFVFSAITWIFTYYTFTESLAEHHRQTLSIKSVINNFHTVLKNKTFVGNALSLSLLFSSVITFIQIAPFILQKELHLTAVTYGWVLLCLGGAAITGASVNTRLLNHLEIKTNIFVGLSISLCMLVVMLIFGLVSYFNIWVILIPLLFVRFGNALVFPNNAANAMQQFPQLAGAASALLGFIGVVVAFIASLITAHLSYESQLPLVTLLLVEVGGALVFSWWGYRRTA